MKKLKKVLAAAAALFSALLPLKTQDTYINDFSVSAVSASDEIKLDVNYLSGESSNNISNNRYGRWSSVVNSYLFENQDKTITRLECIGSSKLIAEVYDKEYSLIDTYQIDFPLDIFGGFYSGSEYNYIVFGKTNSAESDQNEVMRVVKYSKNWEEIAYCPVYGANTTVPFDAGSLRMTETGGQLYVHTCHEMYTSDDGYNHQANMTFVFDTAKMEINQSYYGVMNIDYGYVSHSFNQFIAADDEFIYRADHGDSYPRSIVLTKCKAGGSITNVDYVDMISFKGNIGDNSTGACLGGLALSENNCIVAGNSIDQNDSETGYTGQRNIFVSVADKKLTGANIVWLTDYTGQSGITPYNPQLVKVNDNRFLVMWEEYDSGEECTYVKIAPIDENGSLTGDIEKKNVRLSDCQPVITSDGIMMWYVTDNTDVKLYSIDPYTLKGDIGDEIIYDLDDAESLMKFLIGKQVTADFSFDINSDGKINIFDLIILKNHI